MSVPAASNSTASNSSGESDVRESAARERAVRESAARERAAGQRAVRESAGYPVAIIGAGPVGLAAAAHLHERGIDFVVVEAGSSAGTSVAAWGHVRLFSPWEFLVDAAAGRLLDASGWDSPHAKRLPYGRELVADYLLPLAATPELAPHIRYNSRVTAVTRQGMDRTRSRNRDAVPFSLRIVAGGDAETVGATGAATHFLARAVIDTSGTYTTPNPLAANGLPLTIEDDVRARISPALPDVLGTDRATFAGQHTLVVGAGHSAANTLLALAQLARDEPGTTISWAIRGNSPARVYGASTDEAATDELLADELPGRGRLGADVHDLVRRGAVALVDGFEIDDVTLAAEGRVAVIGRRRGEPLRVEADRVVAATGFRPDLDLTREIRLSLDEIVEAPRALAPLIDPNLHSCGSVPPHGVAELTHPESDFYIAGMKSYGRAPTFLLATGYEQVRSIADELAGDSEAARRVTLVLPETGVCSTSTSSGDATGAAVSAAGARPALSLSITSTGGGGGCCA